MAKYVEGFVVPVPKRNLAVYRRMAQKMGKIFRSHGALEFRECVADSKSPKMGVPFARLAKVKRGETVFFSWIVYKSRADRDRIVPKVMADPRGAGMDMNDMPFDMKRMAYGGFEIAVDV